jgi:predicted nicotinamide N-methyase
MQKITQHGGLDQVETLKRALADRFALCNSMIDLPGGPLSITHLQNPDALLDELADAPDDDPRVVDEQLPYWAWIWPSAVALARHVRASEQDLAGRKVLEIGCGLGLPGVAAMSLSQSVTFTDYSQDALDFAHVNALGNTGKSPSCRLLDWRNCPDTLSADVILASDVAYETRFFEPLCKLFKKVLRPGGTIMLSEPCRKIAGQFFDHLEQDNWTMRYREEEVIHGDNWAQVRIFRIHR